MDINEAIATLSANPKGIGFNTLAKICDHFFGEPRKAATSHRSYKMPWPGDPRVNIQPRKGMAKPYQVRQAITALTKLRDEYPALHLSGHVVC